MELAASGILKRVVQSEKEGSEAVIIWGGHDPSLEASRELVSIPVLGPGMVSMLLAISLAKRFALLVQLSEVVDIAERQIRELGVQDKCIGVYSVDIPVLQLRKPESFDKVMNVAIQAINDGADALCFGCMALNDHVPKLQEYLKKTNPGVIVIHPGAAVIKLAEMLIKMNLSHSKSSYPTPSKEIIFPK
jgi:allantoin racemase